jgi:S1-C subfamily serine protease
MTFRLIGFACGKPRFLTAAIAGFLLLASDPVRGVAGVREAIKRALPATVCVEQRDASGTAANARATSTGTAANDTVSTGSVASDLTMSAGTVVSADGLIVTTLPHKSGGSFRVTLGDGRETEGKLLVDDRRTGLKLVKINAANLPFLTPKEQSPPIGEDVVATYCVTLKQRAVARGIVAAVDCELAETGGDLLQLDINVGPMSAGGPIVDEEGQLRGIIAYQDGGHSATFALPASKVVALLHARRGDSLTVIRRPRLGVQLNEPEAKVIAHPIKGGAAIAAGVREGDEMLALDDVKLKRHADLTRFMSHHAAGDKVRLSIRRGGKEQTIDVTLAPAPEDKEQSALQNAVSELRLDLNVVTPGQLYVTEGNGSLKVLEGVQNLNIVTGQGLKVKENQLIVTAPAIPAATHTQESGQVSTPSIRVERSDVERRLEQIGRDVLTLRQQMEALTDEMRRLQKELSNDAGHRTGK